MKPAYSFNDSVTALQQADLAKTGTNDHDVYEYLTLGAETDKLHQTALSESSPYGIIDLPLEDLKSIRMDYINVTTGRAER